MVGQESLGEAVLYLTVDDRALRDGVSKAKEFIKDELGSEVRVGKSGGASRSQRSEKTDEFNARQRELEFEERLTKRLRLREKRALQASRALNRDRQSRLNSALVGGAFPLLFGQGLAASAGGVLGGAVGGSALGMGLSLAGSLIGQTIDQLVQGGTALATALQSPIKSFGVIQEQSALSSRALEKYAGSLIATGRNAEAAALIQLDTLRLGDTSNLEELASAQDELNRNFAVLGTAISNFVAGPLANLLKSINQGIRKGPTAGADGLPQFEDTLRQLQRAQKIRQEGLGLAAGGSAAALIPALGLFGGITAGIGAGMVLYADAIQPDAVSDLDEFLRLTKQVKDAKNDVNRLGEIEINLIEGVTAEQRKSLRLEAAQIAKKQALAAAGTNVVEKAKAEKDFKLETAKIDSDYRKESLADTNKQIDATLRLLKATLKLRQSQRQAANPPRFGETATAEVVRKTDFSVAGARDAIALARAELVAAQERLSEAQRIGTPADIKSATNALNLASFNLKDAGIGLKIAMQEGANSILENVKSAAERFRDSVRGVRDLRLGNLRFLPADQRRELIQEQIRKALPEARRRGVRLRGLADVISFNRFVEQEQGALQTRDDARRNLVEANNSLANEVVRQTGALSTLTQVMNRLIDKSWAVYVEVPGQNGAASLNMSNQLN